jgi:DNA adenine methylase
MNLNLTTIEESLLEVHWRLERVTIEHLTACRCIEKYDRKETFFYVDPPYYHVTQDYCQEFTDDDFIRIRDTLKSIKGRFILSLNDTADIRSMFKAFRQVLVATKYSSGNSRTAADTRSKERRELLIHNLDR